MTVQSRMTTPLVIENPAGGEAPDQAANEYGDADDLNATNWVAYETPAYIVPVGSGEDEVDRETRARQYTVFVGHDVDVRGTSRLRWTERANTALEVELEARVLGDPLHWSSARGPSHTVVRAEVIAG